MAAPTLGDQRGREGTGGDGRGREGTRADGRGREGTRGDGRGREGTRADGRGSGALHWPEGPQAWAGRSLQKLKFHSRAEFHLLSVSWGFTRLGRAVTLPHLLREFPLSPQRALGSLDDQKSSWPQRLSRLAPRRPQSLSGLGGYLGLYGASFPSQLPQVSALRPSILMLDFPHGSALGSCWGALHLPPAQTSSFPERSRRLLPGLSPTGKVSRQVPVHRPPDDHPSSCRTLPSGRPARNTLLSPCMHARRTRVCTHATHACALTAHLRRQRCTLTGARHPRPFLGPLHRALITCCHSRLT